MSKLQTQHKTIYQFMKSNRRVIKDEVLAKITNKDFDSHEFIRHFSKKFEIVYVFYLSKYEKNPFRNVNAQIGRFLSKNQDYLEIEDLGVKNSLTIFGSDNKNENWRKKNCP
jgi:hypothetical protein